MSNAKNKGGREVKKPKADSNKKVTGQTPGPTTPAIGAGNKASKAGR
ncbi:MAG: hypothetical protein JWL64_475 [Frankiales bacterium]|nr:hypothetical protein [Frankiales bacterium]